MDHTRAFTTTQETKWEKIEEWSEFIISMHVLFSLDRSEWHAVLQFTETYPIFLYNFLAPSPDIKTTTPDPLRTSSEESTRSEVNTWSKFDIFSMAWRGMTWLGMMA